MLNIAIPDNMQELTPKITVIGGLLSINRSNTIHNNNINLNEKLNSFQKFYRWMATNV